MTPEPFDRRLRRLRRDRAALRFGEFAFLKDALVGEIVARLFELGRRYGHALDLGCHDGRLGRRLPAERVTFADAGLAFARAAGGVMCDEDRLPFGPATFDLIASAGSLHGVNDLPGALAQAARALRPGGRFIAALPGGDTLFALRAALFEAEEAVLGGVSARVHPNVDPREAPSLLQRAGFGDPVVDVEPLRLRYADLSGLMRDLRGGGETNVLHARSRVPVGRALLAAAAERFRAGAEADGRVPVTMQVLHMTAVVPGGI